MNRKRFQKKVRALVVDHAARNNYKCSEKKFEFRKMGINREGSPNTSYETCYNAIKKALG